VNSLTGTKTLFTLGGGVLNTDTGTNGTIVATASQTTLTASMNQAMNFDTGVGVVNYIANNVDATLASSELKYLSGSVDVSTKTTSQSGQTDLLARVENLATNQFSDRVNIVTSIGIVDNLTSYSAGGSPYVKTVNIGNQINQTNALFGLTYTDNTLLNTNSIGSICNASGSELKINAQDNNLGNTHEITIETPLSGDAIISHTVVGTARNLGISTAGNLTISADNIDLSSTGRLIVPSLASGDYLDYNPTTANLTLATNNTGTPANPMLTLNQNDTATGAGTMKFYKNLNVVGNDIGVITFNANTTTANNQEYARIASTIRSNTSGNLDGSIGLFARVNNSNTEFIRVNGVDSQTEFLRPIDMNNNAITTGTGDITLSATASTGTGDIFLTPNVATGSVKVSKDIITDSKIRNTDITASSIDFAGGSADYRFNMDTTRIELHYNNASTSLSTQQIFQDIINEEAYFKQTYTDLVGVNTLETILENDLTHHRIKLSETASGANTEITKDEIDIDDGGGNVAKLTATDLTFNNVSIRPIRSNTNGLAFSVSGSPTIALLSVPVTEMTAGTIWKVDVAFYTNALNTANVITYTITDTTPQYVEQNSVFGYSQGGLQNAIQYLSSGTPMAAYCSFTDTFEVNGLASGSCSFNLTAGTSDSSIWGGGGAVCSISIVLTRLG